MVPENPAAGVTVTESPLTAAVPWPVSVDGRRRSSAPSPGTGWHRSPAPDRHGLAGRGVGLQVVVGHRLGPVGGRDGELVRGGGFKPARILGLHLHGPARCRAACRPWPRLSGSAVDAGVEACREPRRPARTSCCRRRRRRGPWSAWPGPWRRSPPWERQPWLPSSTGGLLRFGSGSTLVRMLRVDFSPAGSSGPVPSVTSKLMRARGPRNPCRRCT